MVVGGYIGFLRRLETLMLKTNLICSHFLHSHVPIFPRDSLLCPYYKSMGILILSVDWLSETQNVILVALAQAPVSFLRTLGNTNVIVFINHYSYVNILYMFWELKCLSPEINLFMNLMKVIHEMWYTRRRNFCIGAVWFSSILGS